MLHAVIMAGGSGTRLWPESRRRRPKQLLRIEGDRTMLRTTVDRLRPLVEERRIAIATTAELAEATREATDGLSGCSLLLEPASRNTAPCIGLAAVHLVQKDPDAVMLVVPADHVITPEDAFRDAVCWAQTLVSEDPARLVTFGIRPTYAATGFGYIECGDVLTSRSPHTLSRATFRVQGFREKPNAETAAEYLERGTFFWNSGMFVWRAATILDLLKRFEPALHEGLERIAAAIDGPRYEETLQREFAALKSVSIDYAVMEKAAEVAVVEAPFTWDDVGSWQAIQRLVKQDEHGNTLDARRCVALETSGTIVRCLESDKTVTLYGVSNLIIVDSPDALLVAHKGDEAAVRKIVDELRHRGWDDIL